MKRHLIMWALSLSALLTALCLTPVTTVACPGCSEPMLTLSEQFAKSDAAVLVEWVSAEMPTADKAGKTVWEITKVAKSPVARFAPGKRLLLDRYRAGKKGDKALVLGSQLGGDQIEWGAPLEISEAGFDYIVHTPALGAPPAERLTYYLKFFENADPIIAADAFQEFANSPYKDIAHVADKLPREKLRKVVADYDNPATAPRLGVYGFLLGLCGTPEDAELMEKIIVSDSSNYRLGINGVMSGYLLLVGEKGLAVLEKSKIVENKDKKTPFSETYAAMQALRFVWTEGNGRISGDRLKESMRLLLDRPDLADLVIADLARWKDWSIQDRLMSLYGTEGYDIPTIKRAIIRYMMVSSKDAPAAEGEPTPKHVLTGALYLQKLRDRDPKLVNDAERYFFLN